MKNLDLEPEIYGNADDSSISQQGDERLRFSLNKLRAVSYDTEVGFLAPSRHRSLPLETCTIPYLQLSWCFCFPHSLKNHVAVLTQLLGSVWPRVLPYCCCNILITSIIYYLKRFKNLDVTCSDRGHTFMALMVSFLIVTRSNIAYACFMEARDFLNNAMKACRELTQHMITFTRYELKTPAMQWRQENAR